MSSRKKTIEDIRFQQRLGKGLLVAGIVSGLAGAIVFENARAFRRSALRASGHIIEVEQRRFRKDVTCYPIFSFTDPSGATNIVRSKFGYALNRWGLSRQYAIGDRVEVIYPASDPASARLDDSWAVWGWAIVTSRGGVALVGAGIVLWQGAIRWKRELA